VYEIFLSDLPLGKFCVIRLGKVLPIPLRPKFVLCKAKYLLANCETLFYITLAMN